MKFSTLIALALAGCAADKSADDTANPSGDGGGEEACTTEFYRDLDVDGYGDVNAPTTACEAPDGYVSDATDCDDDDEDVNPAGTEVCDGVDNDCNGSVDDASDLPTWYADADGDNYGDPAIAVSSCQSPAGFSGNDDDCDDTDIYTSPSAAESCDGIDNDCDDEVDEDDAVNRLQWYPDNDGDGYGSGDTSDIVWACDQPSGLTDDNTDCDDSAAVTYPGADELCDATDNDCDGEIDDNPSDPSPWYIDLDGDGYGDDSTETISCESAASGSVAVGGDCDDRDATENPGAGELCDGADNDCDGDVDEESDITDPTTWYADGDGDGYGDSLTSTASCAQPSGYVSSGGDCDDTTTEVGPGGEETWYDGFDSDCDGGSDYDADSDGVDSDDWGGTDCDDSEGTVYPGGTEYCDGLDNNCDGTTDPDTAADAPTWYIDADGDGYGVSTTTAVSCSAPDGYVDNDDDCDDADADVEECTCNLTAVDSPTKITSAGSTYGQWMSDPLETLGSGLYWEMDSYTGSTTLTEYPSLADLVARTGATTITLPYSYDGTGATVYDGYLYYNMGGSNYLVQYDLAAGTYNTLELTGAGYRNTYHYAWGGYSDIDFAVDEMGLWVLYSTAANGGKLVISSIDPATFTVVDTWNTGSTVKTSLGNAFMICGVMYTVQSYSAAATTVGYSYDTTTGTEGAPGLKWVNSYGYNSMIDYNPGEGIIYGWDSTVRVTYDLTIE